MSHALTEVAVHTAAVTVPDPGQPVLANDIEVACQALANRTKLLLDPFNPLVNRRRVVKAPPLFNAEFWEHSTSPTTANPLVSLTGSAGPSVDKRKVIYMLDVPHGSTLTHVQLALQAASGHGGVLPPNTVGMRFEKQAWDTGVVTAGSVDSDPSGIGTYESYHLFTLNITPDEVIDLDTYRYYVRVSNEGGGGSAIEAGLQLFGLAQLYVPGTYPGGL